MAILTLFMTVLSVLWKSPIGVKWIPFLGPAMMQIMETRMEGQGDGDAVYQRPAQYPRRQGDDDDDAKWEFIYLCMYGIFGVLAQYGGRKLSQGQPLVRWALLYGIFHLTLGVHHLMWAVPGVLGNQYGKLELWRYELPGAYATTAFAALIMMAQAGRILCMVMVAGGSSRGRKGVQGRLSTMHLHKIRHIKSVLDTCSVWTLFGFLFFWIFNLLGIHESMDVDRVLWALTMFPVPLIAIQAFW